jgi:hypothetical protein
VQYCRSLYPVAVLRYPQGNHEKAQSRDLAHPSTIISDTDFPPGRPD